MIKRENGTKVLSRRNSPTNATNEKLKMQEAIFFSAESLSSSLQMGSYFSDLVKADNSLNTKDDLHVKATEHDFHELVMTA